MQNCADDIQGHSPYILTLKKHKIRLKTKFWSKILNLHKFWTFTNFELQQYVVASDLTKSLSNILITKLEY